MCGIAGILSLDGGTPPDRGELGAMAAALAHRGPDGAGELNDGPLGLAIRRLAIVDPAGGHQPLASEDAAVHLVCNGEIYNAPALRRDLERRGHRFASRSDVEVIVHLYEERGLGFLAELRGMFALALWDARERRLVLARDPFGIKPLVYALAPGRLAFASELKALLTLPWLSREIDLEALETYLAVNAVLAPRTIFRDARKLPAGHVLVAGAGAVHVERYARPGPVPAGAVRREPPAALAAELRERLADSVRAHLEADVEVGVLLSGGLDSGIVTGLAAAELARPLKTFSVGFTEPSFDELAGARQVARRYGTEHRELVVGPDAAADLHAVAATFDEPRGDSTALPYWLAARLAATEVKAVLSGEGGDELFGGYQTYVAGRLAPWARPLAAAEPLLARWPSSSRRLSLDFKLRRLARGAGLGPVERHHAYKEIFSAAARAELLRPERRGAEDPVDAYRRRYAETPGVEPVARLQDLDVGTFLADDLLAQTDRAGMAHGLEIRVPFLDPVVAELAHALPVAARVRGLQTKPLLRAAAAPLLPGAIVRGPKRGFCAPAAAWLRGPLLPLARELLAPERVREQGFFAPAVVTALLERHVARREDLSRPLWALVAFGLWHDTHAAAPAPVAAGGVGSVRAAA
jgi:asparagine synthase (glutamine-hydrolysing)